MQLPTEEWGLKGYGSCKLCLLFNELVELIQELVLAINLIILINYCEF